MPNNFPSTFTEKLRKIIPPGLWGDVQNGFADSKKTTFRINTLKATPEKVIKQLSSAGLTLEEIKNFPISYTLKKGSFKKLRDSDCYVKGEIYLQNLSSQIPPLVLNPQPGEKILDFCAAPGSKTTQMAVMMKNVGEIVALEPDRIRCERLKSNVEKQGAGIVKVFQTKAEDFPASNSFDRILLDVPCSGEGTFSLNDPQSFRHWSEGFVSELNRTQNVLIKSAWAHLKPGGFLVYSTCALSPEENESVLDNFLKENSNAQIIDIPFKWPFLKPALVSWKNQKFHPAVQKSRRIYPSAMMEGFFVCAMKKS